MNRHPILSPRTVTIFAIVVLLMLMVGRNLAATRQQAAASDQPIVAVGQVYQFVYGCLPKLGCYAEVVQIDRVRLDGWVDGRNCAVNPRQEVTRCEERWRTNLAHVMAVRPHPNGHQAN